MSTPGCRKWGKPTGSPWAPSLQARWSFYCLPLCSREHLSHWVCLQLQASEVPWVPCDLPAAASPCSCGCAAGLALPSAPPAPNPTPRAFVPPTPAVTASPENPPSALLQIPKLSQNRWPSQLRDRVPDRRAPPHCQHPLEVGTVLPSGGCSPHSTLPCLSPACRPHAETTSYSPRTL